MSDRKPLVQVAGTLQQLQSQDDLEIPLNERVSLLEQQIKALTEFLLAQGIELPEELTELL